MHKGRGVSLIQRMRRGSLTRASGLKCRGCRQAALIMPMCHMCTHSRVCRDHICSRPSNVSVVCMACMLPLVNLVTAVSCSLPCTHYWLMAMEPFLEALEGACVCLMLTVQLRSAWLRRRSMGGAFNAVLLICLSWLASVMKIGWPCMLEQRQSSCSSGTHTAFMCSLCFTGQWQPQSNMSALVPAKAAVLVAVPGHTHYYACNGSRQAGRAAWGSTMQPGQHGICAVGLFTLGYETRSELV